MEMKLSQPGFCGNDREGVLNVLPVRGEPLDKYGKPFKGDVPGNDKTYGVNLVNTHMIRPCI